MKRMQLKQKIARHVTSKSNNQRYAVFFCAVLCHAMSPLSISAYPTLFHSILSFHKMSSSLILPHIILCFVFYSVPCCSAIVCSLICYVQLFNHFPSQPILLYYIPSYPFIKCLPALSYPISSYALYSILFRAALLQSVV